MLDLLHANDRPGRYPQSWYAASIPQPAPRPALRGSAQADVCVIGGGYTGLSTAWNLARAGYAVRLVEAHRVGFGASGRNGGQVGSGQRVDQMRLERWVGKEDAHRLWSIAEEAKALVRELATGPIPEARWRPGIVEACWRPREVRETHLHAEHLARQYGYDALELLDRPGIGAIVRSPAYVGGVLDRGAGHIHPLALALGLARMAEEAGAVLHERTEAHHLDFSGPRPVVRTDRGRIEADEIVLATNGYVGGLDRRLGARVMPINNFIIATAPLGERAMREVLARDVAVADSRFVVNYFRLSHDRRLLFGGGESYGYRFPRDIAALVRRPMLEVFPHLADVAIDHAWGGTLGITMKRLPWFAAPRPGLWVAAGYSGHGVALATLAGRILAEALRGRRERFDVMARLPVPRFPGGALMRWPLLVMAMSWYALRDRLGV